jgi:putative ABC transport system permease protein
MPLIMKWLPFVLQHLQQNWIRTASTAAAIAVCIFLFCTLQTFVASLRGSLDQGAVRLITRNNVSRFYKLPNSYEERIAALPGVTRVAAANYFGGMRDVSRPESEFANFAIEAQSFLAMYPEYILTESERQAFLADQHGAIIGGSLAEQFHWKVGDTVQLTSNIYRTGSPFEFLISAIYRTDQTRYPGTSEATLFLHYKYLDEATRRTAGVRTYRVQIANPRQAGLISRAIDDLFENSEAQTHTETEAQYRANAGILGGNLALLLDGIGLAVMFTLLLVTANTMSMAVRERRTEIGVLKALGFPERIVVWLILAEGILLGVCGAVLGLALGGALIGLLPDLPVIGDLIRAFPRMRVPPSIAGAGIMIGALLGLTASLLPAAPACRARIVELLRMA